MNKAVTHWHHIVPVHAGGTNDPSNLVELTVEEHAEAHRELWEKNADIRDYLAWKTLSGQATETEKMLIRNQLAHEKKLKNGFYKQLGELNRKRLTGKKRPDVSKANKAFWKKNKLKWWNNGQNSQRALNCPGPDWKLGRLRFMSDKTKESLRQNMKKRKWWTDGTKNTRQETCPGPEWRLGRS